MKDYQHTVLDRFLRYVQVDTQSDPRSTTFPSTEKQKNLSRMLVDELQAMGVTDAELDEHGYVYATIPAHTDNTEAPTICFCSHVDTSPDASGTDVRPIVHRNYDGKDIVLPHGGVVIRPDEHPDLKAQVGNDIVTASGTTLLGADNKAGVAAIMDMAHYFMTHPDAKRTRIRILFTPDEEIGRGVDHVDMQKLDATYGYTIDGETLGSMEDETFSADGVKITIHGVSAHPGFAKDKLENAIKIAGTILDRLPKDRLSPETTSGKEGFIHPVHIEGKASATELSFIIRDFTVEGLQSHEAHLRTIMEEVLQDYPGSRAEYVVTEQYRNMKTVLDRHPEVVQHALTAIRRAGLTPNRRSIRGGTDGSRLSFMGLPCPNIFAGEHAFHSEKEWVSVQDMQKSCEVMIHLAELWQS